MKKLLSLLLVVVLAVGMLASCETSDPSKKSEGVMTYAEYDAAKKGDKVVIEAYIQAVQAYNEQYKNTSLYLADTEGGYFVFRYACDEATYAKLTRGTKVKVTGSKAIWGGWEEVDAGATIEIIDEPHWVWSAIDVTENLGKEDFLKDQNRLVAFKDMVITSINVPDDGGDIYFDAKNGDNTINFCVESDLMNKDTDLYKMFTDEKNPLKVGDKLDIEGYLIVWEEAANPHVVKITKK